MQQRRRRASPDAAEGSAAPAPDIAPAHRHHRTRLLRLACLSRLALITYAIVADTLIPDHDAEGALQLPDAATLPFPLRPFTRWDAAHFLSIAQAGRYPTLPSHAFFPLYPALVRGVAGLLSSFSTSASPSLAALVLAALLVTNLSFVGATLALYELTRRVLGGEAVEEEEGQGQGRRRTTRGSATQQKGDEEAAARVAFVSALLYICSPASIFYTTAYSEALYSALTFIGLLLVVSTARLPRFALGCLLLAGASATRSNGILNCLPLALSPTITRPLLLHLSQQATTTTTTMTTTTKKQQHQQQKEGGASLWSWAWVGEVALRGLGCLLVLAPYLGLQYYGWRKFCTGSVVDINNHNDDLAWCHHRRWPFLPPSLYSHIQHTYWGVGFLRYWHAKQLPNFLLAAPVLLLTAQGAGGYLAAVLLPHRAGSQQLWARYAQPPPGLLLGYHLQWLLLGAFTLLVAHVQIATRLLGAACPPLYWFVALRLLQEEQEHTQLQQKKTIKEGEGKGRFRTLVVVYYALYNVLGPLLHCNFLPWT